MSTTSTTQTTSTTSGPSLLARSGSSRRDEVDAPAVGHRRRIGEFARHFLFAPATPEWLGITRFAFFVVVFVVQMIALTRTVDPATTLDLPGFHQSVPLLHAVGLDRLGDAARHRLAAVFLVVLATAALGICTRVSALICFVFSGYFWLLGQSAGTWDVRPELPTLAMLVLAMAGSGDAFSVDRLVRRRRGGCRMARYRWPIRVVQVVTLFSFAAGAVAAVRMNGVAWLDGSAFASLLRLRAEVADTLPPMASSAATYVADQRWLCALLGLAIMVVQLAAPLAILFKRLRKPLLIGVAIIALVRVVLLGWYPWHWAALGCFFVPWPTVMAFVRRRETIQIGLFAAAAVAILVVGLFVRLDLMARVSQAHDLKSFSLIHGDTREYVHLGEELYRHGRYNDPNDMLSSHRALVRPPLYPAIYTIPRGFNYEPRDLKRMARFQVPFGLLVPILTGWLAWLTFRSPPLVLGVALLASLSPTGWSVSTVVLPDLFFTIFFTAGFCLQRVAAGRSCWRGMLTFAFGAGVFYALAVLTKPALLLWPLVVLWVWVMQRKAIGETVLPLWRPKSIVPVAVLLVPLVASIVGWSARNASIEGDFTFSTISTRNLRYYVSPYVDLVAEHHRWPKRKEFKAAFAEIALSQETYLQHPEKGNAAELARKQRAEALAVLGHHPLATAVVLTTNMLDLVSDRNRLMQRQLPGDRPAHRIYRGINNVTGSVPVAILWLGGVVAAPVVFLRRHRKEPREGEEGNGNRGWQVLAIFTAWGYFAVLCSTTHGEGARVMYAVEPLALVLIAGTMFAICDMIRRRSHEQRSTREFVTAS